MKKLARDVKVGDLMDLEGDGLAQPLMTEVDWYAAEFNYFPVCQVEYQGGWVMLGWEGIGGLAAYPPDHLVTVSE